MSTQTFTSSVELKLLKNARPLGCGAGEKNSMAKLKSQQIKNIRESTLKAKELAKIYGVSQSSISRIRNRISWTHIG